MDDSTYKQFVEFKRTNKVPSNYRSVYANKSNFIRASKRFAEANGVLFFQNRIVVKASEINHVFQELHAGHCGRDKTWLSFRARYYAPGAEKLIRMKVKNCVYCSHKSDAIWKALMPPLQPIAVTPTLWSRVHIDLIGPLPKTANNNMYIAIAICAFSKYVEAKRNDLD